MDTWNRIGDGRTQHLITHDYGQLFQIAACGRAGKSFCALDLPKCKTCQKIIESEKGIVDVEN